MTEAKMKRVVELLDEAFALVPAGQERELEEARRIQIEPTVAGFLGGIQKHLSPDEQDELIGALLS